jgi:hypothetical protein
MSHVTTTPLSKAIQKLLANSLTASGKKRLSTLIFIRLTIIIVVAAVATFCFAGPSDEFVEMPMNNYLDLLLVIALKFIQGKTPLKLPYSDTLATENETVQIASAEFLQYLLLKSNTIWLYSLSLSLSLSYYYFIFLQ